MMSIFSMIWVSLVGLAVLLTAVQVESDCPNIQGCNFDSDDCTSLKCSTSFMGKDISLGITLNACQKDITTTIDVDDFDGSFSHTFSSEQDVPIPSLDLGTLGKVYLKYKMSRNDNKEVHLKVALAVIVSFGDSLTIVDENLGRIRKSMYCGFFIWLGDQPTNVQGAVYGGFGIALLIIISSMCCYCRKKRCPGVFLQPYDGPTNLTTEYVKF